MAPALDHFEGRPLRSARNTDADGVIVSLLSALLEAHPNEHSATPFDTAAHDLLALVKGMIDSASESGEGSAVDFERRMFSAVSGYLGVSRSRCESARAVRRCARLP